MAPKAFVLADSEDGLLDRLDPGINTVPYLLTLNAVIQSSFNLRSKKVPAALQPDGRIWARILDFTSSFDKYQIRYVPGEMRQLMDLTIHIGRCLGDMAQVVIFPLQAAMHRIDDTVGTFTSLHLDYVRLIHETGMYSEALSIVSQPIHSFPPLPLKAADREFGADGRTFWSNFASSRDYILQTGLSDKIKPADVYEYFLLAGMVYLALEDYKNASLNFEHVITAPNIGSPHVFMLEAYQKWLLCQCLANGHSPAAPSTTNSTALKHLQNAAKPYTALASIFKSGDRARLFAEIDVGQSVWTNDGNWGLVDQLARHLDRFHILNLQKCYSALPLSFVAHGLNRSSSDTKRFIEMLISTNQLNAETQMPPNTSASEPVLRLYPETRISGPLARTELQQLEALKAQTGRTEKIAGFVRAANLRASVTKEYLQFEAKAKKDEASGRGGPSNMADVLPGGGPPMDGFGHAVDDDDEDLMADG
ncbi:hypothetical protein K402DRAFT_336666 [Aulographum hederae CBS 113979]|uniref:COP9 signalosome complex subunit 3 n=1 Tax=Aulographum hederae CBS 113979 TaxID=1176131 RepID=A0A6G1GU29_9PEZI|nr:hypothetical protein K402DRAFT_336666 [Aulographum hederae CBS 113979]